MPHGPIRLGVAPIAWSNSDLPELGGDTPLETCLAESRAAGYSGTETGVKFPLDPAVLGPILRQHELALVSGWFSGRLLDLSVEEEKRRIEPQLACFAALGAPVLVYAETTGSVQAARTVPASRRRRLNSDEFKRLGEKMTALAEHMAARGVRLAYHHHVATVVETDDEIDWLMQATGPAVGLLVDTGHAAYAGGDWRGLAEEYASRVVHVHCKDVRPAALARVRAEELSFLDAVLAGVFTVPGDGYIDYVAFAQTLAGIGYRGWVVVEAEQDPAKAPPFAYARNGRAHLAAAFEQAGFAIAA
ncbi:MAG: myo-inosose-2 dehydratase [Alphaproteobacteria bacterium]|nr:myo-inosose-2 dehydratase [Alphaproteobacteria bacterium]